MHEAYKSDEALCKWLRDNISGSYVKCGYAAERIETLTAHLASVQDVCDKQLNLLSAVINNGTFHGDNWVPTEETLDKVDAAVCAASKSKPSY